MTNLLILPGNSTRNQELLDSYAEHFKDKDFNIITVPWKHWSDENKDYTDETEVERIVQIIKSTPGDFYIIAKSVGTVLFSKALDHIDHSIIRSITYLGLPIAGKIEKYKKYYNALNELNDCPITFIQAKNDPYASFDEVVDFTKNELNNYQIELIAIDRSDHDYPIEDVKKTLAIT
jgi:predicted alpha/beta hydrolase family esterase